MKGCFSLGQTISRIHQTYPSTKLKNKFLFNNFYAIVFVVLLSLQINCIHTVFTIFGNYIHDISFQLAHFNSVDIQMSLAYYYI